MRCLGRPSAGTTKTAKCLQLHPSHQNGKTLLLLVLLSPPKTFYSPSFVKLPQIRSRRRKQITSEITNPQNWVAVDYTVSKIDPIHILPNYNPPLVPMSSSSNLLNSTVKNPKRICLFYCPETQALAERVAAQSDAVQLRSIRWRYICHHQNEVLDHGVSKEHYPSSCSTKERFYFGDNILPCFESGIPLLMKRLQELPDSNNISIAFPDDGAWKRFHKQLQHFPMIVCAKVREGDQRIVRIKEGDPSGRHVVIVDDLVQSGSTLIECQKVLAAHGAVKISAYVTHGIFPNCSWERFKCGSGGCPVEGLTYFWITDSCPLTVKEVKNRPPFEVLSLAGSIAAALQI